MSQNRLGSQPQMVNELFFGKFSKCPGHITKKSTEEIQCFRAPASIEILNLWNDFRKVMKFIDENPWVKPMLEKIIQMKNRDNV